MVGDDLLTESGYQRRWFSESQTKEVMKRDLNYGNVVDNDGIHREDSKIDVRQ